MVESKAKNLASTNLYKYAVGEHYEDTRIEEKLIAG